MLSASINYETANAKDLFESIKNQMYSNERSSSSVKLINNTIIFTIESKDIVALRASFNAIRQIITINEKLKKVTKDE